MIGCFRPFHKLKYSVWLQATRLALYVTLSQIEYLFRLSRKANTEMVYDDGALCLVMRRKIQSTKWQSSEMNILLSIRISVKKPF